MINKHEFISNYFRIPIRNKLSRRKPQLDNSRDHNPNQSTHQTTNKEIKKASAQLHQSLVDEMGIWEDLRSAAAKFITGKPSSVNRAATNSVNSFTLNPPQNSDDQIAKFLTNISKFAVDETIKGVSGGVQVCRTAKEGLKDQPSSLLSDGNRNQGLMLAMEEMLANMEKMKDGMNGVNQHDTMSSQFDEGLEEPLKEFSDEPVKSSAPEEAGRRRIFIRSRL